MSSKMIPCYAPLCYKTFTDREKLNLHIKVHTGETPFSCKRCDKNFARKDDLNRHIKIHAALRPHACNICGETFVRSNGLVEHFKVHMEPRVVFPCIMCCKTFTRKSSLQFHLWQQHEGKKITYACGLCNNRTFMSKHHLSLHSKIHRDLKLSCDGCGRVFMKNYLLNRHCRRFKGENHYKCNTCGEVILMKCALMVHCKKHFME